MMPDYREIYARQAPEYEMLVLREDHQQNLPRMLYQVRPLSDNIDR